MHLIKTLFLSGILPLAASTAASNGCPRYWGNNTYNEDSKCCYGDMLLAGRAAYCCVWDVDADMARASTATEAPWTSTYSSNFPPSNPCFTKIPFTASDYSSQVFLASVNIRATTTTTGSSTSEASSTSTNSSSRSSNSASATSTSNAAMPIATAKGVVLGGAAVAVALFV